MDTTRDRTEAELNAPGSKFPVRPPARGPLDPARPGPAYTESVATDPAKTAAAPPLYINDIGESLQGTYPPPE